MKLKLFIAVLALQSAWILGTTLQQERLLSSGRVILLETAPVDPRDPLRGDFVRLNYQISDIAADKFQPALTGDLRPGDVLYVALAEQGNGFWSVTRASREMFDPGAGEVLLRGRSQWSWRSTTNSTHHVEYGIEKYFVAEGTGNPRGKLTVQAAVSKTGMVRIKEVFLDGKPYSEAMKP